MQISLDALPATPRLFLDYVQAEPRVAPFFPCSPTLDSVEKFARESAGKQSVPRGELADVLGPQQDRWTENAGGVARIRDGAVTVVTGQQAGLFTGPVLSILKAVTAVKLARELEQRGVPAVPVFWIAADDHDHEEIESTGILNQDSRLQQIRSPLENGVAAPAAWMRYSDGIESVLAEWGAALPASDRNPDIQSMVREAYRPNVSPVDAFARMMLRMFAGTELVMVDPMDPPLRRLSSVLLDTARRRTSDLQQAVNQRTEEVRAAGYREQVRVDQSFTGLFVFENGSRRPLLPSDAGAASPSDLSPNVLLRPLVQDYLFPTAAYVGGPAEIAYFAQAGALYECLGYPRPPIFPRITATLIEPPVSRILKKYDLRFEDVLAGPEHLRARAVGSQADTSIFGEVEEHIREQAERLRPLLEGADKTLGGALDNTVQKLERQLSSLQSRFVAAESRRSELMDRHLEMLSQRLFPGKKLQERSVNVTSFLPRYGSGLISLMDERLELDGSVHQVVEL